MFDWLAGFMFNPTMAIGAGAVASPILIHILSKRRFRRVRWGAMTFLLEAQQRNRRRVRMEQLLLLLLRCLAVLLIALMIARPFVRPGAMASLLGAAPRTERVFLIDDSFSMTCRPPAASSGAERAIFDRAKASALQLAKWFNEETPADSLTVFVTSQPGEPVLSLASLSDEAVHELSEGLDAIQPSQTTARVAESVAETAALLRARPTQANAAVYVIGDFQRGDWVSPPHEGDERPSSVIAPLAALEDEGQSIKLVLINVGDPAAENVAVTALRSTRPQCVAGVPARFEVDVSNHSARPLDQVELSISVAEHRLPPIFIPRIQAGQTLREPVEVTFPLEGSDYIQVQLAGATAGSDAVQLDNTRTTAVDVAAAVQVLIVNGEPSTDPYLDEVYLLRTALRPTGRAASGNELTVIDDSELDDAELDAYHVVILANVSRLSETARRNIEAFTRAGGGLILFAGDHVDIDHYNRDLFRGGSGFLPAALAEVHEAPASAGAMTFTQWDAGHPLMRPFAGKLADVLRQTRIFLCIKIDPASIEVAAPATPATTGPAPNPIDASATASAPAIGGARSPAEVVARFSDADESPAIVQRPFGRGLCLFIATTADQEWNDWASNFSYLPIVLELVQHAARRSDTAVTTVVGNPLVCPIDVRSYRATAGLRTPGYPLVPELSLDAVSDEDQATLLTYADTRKTGLYRFQLETTGGATVERFAAVNPDARESDLTPASEVELAPLREEMPFEYLADVSLLVGQSASARQEMWWPLLIAAMVVLMSEHILAWWFGTRG